MLPAVYENLCPVCGSDLRDRDIDAGKCLIKGKPLPSVYHNKIEDEIENLFREVIGKPREIQRFWIRRISRGESFAAVAPTGIGKTVFGLVVSLFFSLKGKRSYILVPTTILAKQCKENLERFCEKMGKSIGINDDGDVRIAFYHGKLGKKEREKFESIVKEGKFEILVTTTQFLSRNFDMLKDFVFDFIFVDDVDAILKASRNVDRILSLLGFRKVGKEWKGERKGVLMVSTATAKKGRATILFRELLDFDVGSSFFSIRNIEDIFVGREDVNAIREVMRTMGKGGIIYARSSEEAEKYYEELKKHFRIGISISKKKNEYEKFENGEVDFLIGTASYYGTLVRGLDLPEKIRYVIFIGVPVIRTDYDRISPSLLRILALSAKDDERIRDYLPILPKLENYPDKIQELKELIREIYKEDVSRDFVIEGKHIIFPDVRTYIQGSGRASRLTVRGLTKGASFIFENNEKVIRAFRERASYYDIEIKNLKDVDFESLRREIEESRSRKVESIDLIRPALFIVESPTKARLISRFFGKPSVKIYGSIIAYEIPTEKFILIVTACLGHVVDLSTDRGFYGVEIGEDFVPIYSSIKRCKKCNYQYTSEGACPKCGSNDILDSKDRIEDIRKLASQAGLVIIGTDPDAEGEKIAWDIHNFVSPLAEVKRAEFHEVTARAIREALQNLRDIDLNRVKAQIVRRIEDRWIGFTLSHKLWEKFNKTNLSAGRVQTPVLGWIIEQENKYRKRRKVNILPELDIEVEGDFDKEVDVEVILSSDREELRSPLPPHTTDELLRDASRILKLSSGETMKLAQDLFENGLITYHRTDSNRVSDVGLRIAREYLGDDFQGRRWGTGADEGAHECIRPTRAWDRYMLQRMIYERVISPENITKKHLALYDLIFKRFMASQCRDFTVRVKSYLIKIDGREIEDERIVAASGRAFDLYRNVHLKREIPVGKYRTRVETRFVPEGYPYTQADVVKLMKERGLGRPSTYATILEKLFERKYIYERNRLLFSTSLGKRVNHYLNSRYRDFVSEDRTRVLYRKIDEIEEGKLDYRDALREMYEEITRI